MSLTVNVNPDSLVNDTDTFVWGSAKYTSARYYSFIFAQAPRHAALQSIWSSKCLPKTALILKISCYARIGKLREALIVFYAPRLIWNLGIIFSLIVPLRSNAGTLLAAPGIALYPFSLA